MIADARLSFDTRRGWHPVAMYMERTCFLIKVTSSLLKTQFDGCKVRRQSETYTDLYVLRHL
jgi:hypothetical protein